MPIITHNILNAAAQPIEKDASINESFTTESKSEINCLLGDLEVPPLLESSEQGKAEASNLFDLMNLDSNVNGLIPTEFMNGTKVIDLMDGIFISIIEADV
ncbi:hypothetical protein WUBG_18105 [Wuchereria bancrofti]|uniref:Uncharacterized protein n=1 Tax=Wuchereria bancrofti TaxID=6293 RepID=J9E6L3_WUCBA|nr:hypothetical protein WUBG_18105 [Wuchereria bancrofti]